MIFMVIWHPCMHAYRYACRYIDVMYVYSVLYILTVRRSEM